MAPRTKPLQPLMDRMSKKKREAWKRTASTSGRVSYGHLKRPIWPANHTIRKTIERWISARVPQLRRAAREEISWFLCESKRVDDEMPVVWDLLQAHRRRMQRMLATISAERVNLWDVDPATIAVFSDVEDAVRRSIREATRRIPTSHRKWLRSRRPVYGLSAVGPNVTSRIGEHIIRAQCAYNACFQVFLLNKMNPADAMQLALEAIRVAALRRDRDVDPRYMGPVAVRRHVARLEAMPGVSVRFGEPDHLRASGRGGRSAKYPATLARLAVFREFFDKALPRLNPDGRRRRPEIADRIAIGARDMLQRSGRRLSPAERRSLIANILHPRATAHSLAVRCVSILERRSVGAIRKVQLGRNYLSKL